MTAPQSRDHLLDHTLKHGLRSAAAWGTESECLDAETLAAWTDGGLDHQQAALTETHLSNCGRCQELLAALTQTHSTEVSTKRPAVQGLWKWWLVPMTAAAAAGLWMVVPHQDYLAPQAEPPAEIAQAMPSPAPPPTADAPAAPTLAPTPARAPTPVATAPAAEQPAGTRAAADRARADDVRKPAPGAALSDVAERAAKASPAAPALTIPAPQAPAAQAASRDAAAEKAEGKLAVPTVTAPTASVAANRAAAIPVQEPAPPASPPAARTAQDPPPFVAAPAPSAGADARQIVSPDSRFRWRYSTTGLDYSTDGGATWEQVSAAIGRFVTAGTSPSATVCWLVARGGGVYVTVDGRNFFRARFPEITNLAGITATSGTAATVTTTDGRTFVTSDGGATWRIQP